ncbi:MAG: LysM peptidoglycan-binding domain-containing protein, partial [Caldilineaceae bacterium]
MRAVYAGGSPIFNNIAAGTLDIYSPSNELHAFIGQAVGEYTVVIYNDTDIPMTFQLSAENGKFPMEMETSEQASPAATESAAQPSVETREVQTDEVLNETYVVTANDSLSSIAEKLYGHFLYYEELCAYNNISDCNIISVGQTIRTPSLAVLTNAAPVVPVAVATAVSTPVSVQATSGESYTVVAGDTLALIADRVYGDYQRYQEICSFNNLPNCNIISVGQVIRIPDGSRAAEPSAPVAVQVQSAAPTPTAT